MNYPKMEKEIIRNLSKFETYSEKRLYLETIAKKQSESKYEDGKIITKEMIREYLHEWYNSRGHRIFECSVIISKEGL